MAEDAEQTARRVTDSAEHARALAVTARAATAAGEPGLARQLTARAEQIVSGIADPAARVKVQAEVAHAMAAAGDVDHVERVARGIPDQDARARVLADVAGALATSGDLDGAERLVGGIEIPMWRVPPLSLVATRAAAAGDFERAERAARGIPTLDRQVSVLAEVTRAAAAAGELERARRLAADVEQIARGTPDPTEALVSVVGTVACIGEFEHAEQIAHSITDLDRRARALAALAESAAAAGDFARAERVTRSIPTFDWSRGTGAVARATSNTGEFDRAMRSAADAARIACGAADPAWQGDMLTSLAHEEAAAAAAAAGLSGLKQLIADSDTITGGITDQAGKELWLTRMAGLAAATGEFDQAERFISDLADSDYKAWRLVELAEHAALPAPRRRRLLGKAFAVGSFWTPLPAMGKHYPQQLLQVIGALYPDVLQGPADPLFR